MNLPCVPYWLYAFSLCAAFVLGYLFHACREKQTETKVRVLTIGEAQLEEGIRDSAMFRLADETIKKATKDD